jgi:transposase
MTVERCMAEGLVGGEGFAVDASLIRADVHRVIVLTFGRVGS